MCDDSELVLEATRIGLEAQGFEVITVSSPIGMQGAVGDAMPDAVLVDLQMASMRGERVVSAIKKGPRSKDIPVLIYSDRPVAELERAVRESGADDHVSKSPDCAALAAALRRVIRPR